MWARIVTLVAIILYIILICYYFKPLWDLSWYEKWGWTDCPTTLLLLLASGLVLSIMIMSVIYDSWIGLFVLGVALAICHVSPWAHYLGPSSQASLTSLQEQVRNVSSFKSELLSIRESWEKVVDGIFYVSLKDKPKILRCSPLDPSCLGSCALGELQNFAK